MKEYELLAEHFDLVLLLTLHDEAPHFGKMRLERFYRAFAKKYDEYKRRYLAADDSTLCGDRLDTWVMKQHLLDIGFDYEAVCDSIRNEDKQKCDSV